MHYRAKYVIVVLDGIEQPFVFSELSTHAEVARALGGEVLGAGFCYIDGIGQYKCYGESVSLKVKSREDVDAAILNRLFGITDDDPF